MYTRDEAEQATDTVTAVRNDLDNYGGHLRVVIESHDGDTWYEVGEITTWTVDGEQMVVIRQGDRVA